MRQDIVIVGAGIVGLSTAYKLLKRKPDLHLVVLEKESDVAVHQTGRNSGVIHSGIYYKPGSYKARNCIDGRKQLVAFCREYGIAHDICGKVIVAVTESERPRLRKIYDRGLKNGIEGIRLLNRNELQEKEPFVNGIEGIWVPVTGIVDYKGVCNRLKILIEEAGGTILFNQEVHNIQTNHRSLMVQTPDNNFMTSNLINCAGLFSDRVAETSGYEPALQIVPFRGEYYELSTEADHLVRGLIYPVPDPAFPFLGVHFTRMALGGVECGPNAVLALKREGYEKTDINGKDAFEALTYPGFWKLAGRHWKMGMEELYRSFSKKGFLKNLQRLIPSLREEDIKPSPAGVRAMALDRNGQMIDDFYFVKSHHEMHVLNAPSPAATAGLSLGDTIAEESLRQFDLN